MESVMESEKNKPPEVGESKTKRQTKTAAQLEILEKIYSVEAYPSEATRAELAPQLGLSDRQLQMWFCHRRLKDRKPPPVKHLCKESPSQSLKLEALLGKVGKESKPELEPEIGVGSGTYDNESNRRRMNLSSLGARRIGDDVLVIKSHSDFFTQFPVKLRIIASVEAQLGEPLTEDGPLLGMEFDPLPPGAFGTPIETMVHHYQPGYGSEYKICGYQDADSMKASTRVIQEYQFLPEQPSVRTDEHYEHSHPYGIPITASPTVPSLGHPFLHVEKLAPVGCWSSISQQERLSHPFASGLAEPENAQMRNFVTNGAPNADPGAHHMTMMRSPAALSKKSVCDKEDLLQIGRKRKCNEARIAREVEANEKRIRRELEKQDALRRKREEQLRKEMERQQREKQREEERILREKQREEERILKAQKRQMVRREKFLLRESERAEKKRHREETRREKEAERIKAANEKAIARKIAKESMELIEDERLELMELAASSKELPSILSLDSDTLQNLDGFKDKLSSFPPPSVKFKMPFSVKPWEGSDEDVGNLLMVWRFLINFADVLGLWPFTLDELVQAFHDYDSHLLSEIHIALLRCIIKDIEDCERGQSCGFGVNQYSFYNHSRHPQIVEGAYIWGFNITGWLSHLNALTWPEILRQFAISAGYGPRLKKTNPDHALQHNDHEVNNSLTIISTLRNGVAAEKAFAIMQEKGLSNPRRSRHRLTPGTVKFAAFHVLSLEGDEGLTILEVAKKIQKSGLRDLTTSKTPEASIAAALSRDTKLFERIAPSTYRVRLPYRKDPADAESILSAARERIRIFKCGDTRGVDADEVERDDESGSDVADEPESDIATDKEKYVAFHETAKLFENAIFINREGTVENVETSVQFAEAVCKDSSSLQSDDFHNAKRPCGPLDASGVCDADTNLKLASLFFDEETPGEAWVQGLTEGEYSNLCVEDRLNALVALIGVATEGSLFHAVLEERLEAANALKKQMWAEVQVDKRRIRGECTMMANHSTFIRSKSDHNPAMLVVEPGQSPSITVSKCNENLNDAATPQQRRSDAWNNGNNVNCSQSVHVHEICVASESIQPQQVGYAAENLRSHLKSYFSFRAEQHYAYRSLPLGQDRRHNRYWRFNASASPMDLSCGRIFVEFCIGCWRVIESEEGFDSLLASLDVRGVRESHLYFMLRKIETSFKEAVRRETCDTTTKSQSRDTIKLEAVEISSYLNHHSSSDSSCSSIPPSESDACEMSKTFKIELGRNETEKQNALERYQDCERWMWRNTYTASTLFAMKCGKGRGVAQHHLCDNCFDLFFIDSGQCSSCGQNCDLEKSNLHLLDQLAQHSFKLKWDPNSIMGRPALSPSRIRLLRIQLALIEVSIPLESYSSIWSEDHRRSWGLKLLASTSAEELLQALMILENAIKSDAFASNFETTVDHLGSFNQLGKHEGGFFPEKKIPVLSWLPRTTAAVALRLYEFDSSVFHGNSREKVSQRQTGKFAVENSVMRSNRDCEVADIPCRDGELYEVRCVEAGIDSMLGNGQLCGGSKGHGSDGKYPRISDASRASTGKRSRLRNKDGLEQPKVRVSRACVGHKCGRRSIRSRQKKMTAFKVNRIQNQDRWVSEQSSMGIVRDDWNKDELATEVAQDPSKYGKSAYDIDDQTMVANYEDMMVQDDRDINLNKSWNNNDLNMHIDKDNDNEDGDYGMECVGGEYDWEDQENECEENDNPRPFSASSSWEYGE